MRYSALLWKEGVRTMGNNKYKILIVEDEANIRSFIKANLETSDYQVLCAETCALGMMMYASHHPDLIVLDLGLPDRDGLDLIQKVRESDTAAHHCALRPFQREGQGGSPGSGGE